VDELEKQVDQVNQDDERLIEKAVQLSLVEVFIGSTLHAFKIPFSGHFLSLNQGLLLLKFTEKSQSRTKSFTMMVEISMIASCMKAFAPAGKKLGPMISITMQGLFLGIGTFLFGRSLVAQIQSMLFLSLWAFLQPIFSYLIIYGPDLFKAFGYLLKRITKYTGANSESVVMVLCIAVLIKFILASTVPFILRYLNKHGWEKYETLIRKRSGPNPIMKGFREKNPSAVKGAFKDLMTPAFLISLVIMGSFFFISEVDSVHAMWKILRSLGIAFSFFYITRAEWFQNGIQKLAKKSKFVARMYSLAEQSFNQMLKALGK
jgi:hypothetical protein